MNHSLMINPILPLSMVNPILLLIYYLATKMNYICFGCAWSLLFYLDFYIVLYLVKRVVTVLNLWLMWVDIVKWNWSHFVLIYFLFAFSLLSTQPLLFTSFLFLRDWFDSDRLYLSYVFSICELNIGLSLRIDCQINIIFLLISLTEPYIYINNI